MNHSTEIKCPCGEINNKDYLVKSHMGFSVNNPENVVVVETYKCKACGKIYEIVKHYKFDHSEIVYD